MGRYKHIITMIILTYATSLILSGFVESLYMYEKVSQLNFIMRTAGDMALEQTQITDDFFKPGDNFVVKDRLANANEEHKDFKIKVPNSTNTNFEEVNLFEEYTNGLTDKSAIYNTLYSADGSAFKTELDKSDPLALNRDKIKKIKTPIINVNANGRLETIFIPTLAQMGIANTGTYKEQAVDGKKGNRITGNFRQYIDISSDLQGMSKELLKGYELDRVTKMSELDGKDIDYYLTPLALGITYLDRDLLQLLFINNVNLLMRAKYADNMSGSNGPDAYIGKGIVRGETYGDVLTATLEDTYINNGVFSAEVGSPTSHGNLRQGSSNTNEQVEIRYKVIDMYNTAPENERILKEVLGVIPPKTLSDAHVSKYGDYYKSLDLKDRLNGSSSTSTPLTKPIVVAEVKFKLNTIIPYSTLGMRELRAYSNSNGPGVKSRNFLNVNESQFNTTANYLDMRPMQITGKSPTYQASGIPQNGPRLVEYTRLFAITP